MSEKPIVTLFMLASVALPVAAWLVIRWSMGCAPQLGCTPCATRGDQGVAGAKLRREVG